MDENNSIVVLCESEKVTKNTVRYSEVACSVCGDDGPGPVLGSSGTLYVTKDALNKLCGGKTPDQVLVTITLPTTNGDD